MSALARRLVRVEVAVVVALLVIAGISLYVRVVLPYDQVFVDGAVWFRGTDPWYHMRQIENLVSHLPHMSSFDPYMLYPGGGGTPGRPFWDFLVAGVAYILGLGSPSMDLVKHVGAYMPALLGTLTIIPVYFIGRAVFNRWVGSLAALLVAILPGEFLNRSLLGFTDHHIAESVFSTTAIMFLVLAVKDLRQRGVTFAQFRARQWDYVAKSATYTALAGVFLGIYLLSWQGSLLIVFAFSIWVVVQFIIDELTGRSTDYLCIVATPSVLIGTLMLLPVLGGGGLDAVYKVALGLAIAAPAALSLLAHLMKRRRLRSVYYPVAVVGLAAIGFGLISAASPSLLRAMLRQFNIFSPGTTGSTILEAHALFFPHGNFSFQIAWLNFTTTLFISMAGVLVLFVGALRHRNSEQMWVVVWSAVMLAAVLAQRRFSYYFAINAALLTGYMSWKLLDLAGLAKLRVTRERRAKRHTTRAERRKRKQKASEQAAPRGQLVFRPAGAWLKVILAAFLVFFMVFFPCVGLPGIKSSTKVFGLPVKLTQPLAEQSPLIDAAWYNSLVALRHNSPEPFGDPDFYYARYERPFEYPESAYGVMSWWDYGYWIINVAHRLPNAHPGGGHTGVTARFFTAQSEEEANRIMDDMGSKFVMIDHSMATSKFYAIALIGGTDRTEFYDTYYRQTEDGSLRSVNLFYPAYYQTMAARLYNFDGKQVSPSETIVIQYQEKTDDKGMPYKQIVGSWSLGSYEDAKKYIESKEGNNYRIVSANPLQSPVPLEALEDYSLMHESPQKVSIGDGSVGAVKVFEHRLQAGGSP